MNLQVVADTLEYMVFPTAAGWVGVLGSDAGLRRVVLPQGSDSTVRRLLGAGEAEESPRFHDLAERLSAYFAGQVAEFPDSLDLSGSTPFQRKVWEAARGIGYGETRSYGWIAERINQPGAVRAVGQALGRNPLPVIVPCHRVVAGDGGLGGFTGGLAMKRLLLDLEKPRRP